MEICHAIDRVCLCISILNYDVSVEISEDFHTVRFPKPEQVKQLEAVATQGSLV
jgi:hypothetical protein